MERTLGLDVHARSCTLAVISPAGKRLQDLVVETNGQALVEAIRARSRGASTCASRRAHRAPGSTKFSVRMSRNSSWISGPGSARSPAKTDETPRNLLAPSRFHGSPKTGVPTGPGGTMDRHTGAGVAPSSRREAARLYRAPLRSTHGNFNDFTQCGCWRRTGEAVVGAYSPLSDSATRQPQNDMRQWLPHIGSLTAERSPMV